MNEHTLTRFIYYKGMLSLWQDPMPLYVLVSLSTWYIYINIHFAK